MLRFIIVVANNGCSDVLEFCHYSEYVVTQTLHRFTGWMEELNMFMYCAFCKLNVKNDPVCYFIFSLHIGFMCKFCHITKD